MEGAEDKLDIEKVYVLTPRYILERFAELSGRPLEEILDKASVVQVYPPIVRFGKDVFAFHVAIVGLGTNEVIKDYLSSATSKE